MWDQTLMLDEKAQLTVFTLFYRVEVRTLCRPVNFFHIRLANLSLWPLLCALVWSHVGTGKGHPQTVPTKLGVQNCPKCFGMQWLTRFHFVIIPVIVYCGMFSSDEFKWLDTVTYHGTRWEFTVLLRVTHSFTMFAEAVCMPSCLIYNCLMYNCGHGSN